MKRAIQLAEFGLGNTLSNPLVGAVLVKNGNIISEGFHKKFGGPHAEVEALKKLSNDETSNSELYVTLEPCNHTGKTPPCCELIIEKKIKKVWISHKDPNPLVNGSGIKRLIQAGIEVHVGLLEKESRFMNRRFITRYEKDRPYVILKWAETSDGYLGFGEENEPTKGLISDSFSSLLSHRWRSEEQGILVGVNTILNDNPKLTNRKTQGPSPKIFILDPSQKLTGHSLNCVVGRRPSEIIFVTKHENKNQEISPEIEIETCQPYTTDQILKQIAQRNINSILVEGGAITHSNFLTEEHWDEIRVFRSNKFLGRGLKAANIGYLEPKEILKLRDDRLFIYYRQS